MSHHKIGTYFREKERERERDRFRTQCVGSMIEIKLRTNRFLEIKINARANAKTTIDEWVLFPHYVSSENDSTKQPQANSL